MKCNITVPAIKTIMLSTATAAVFAGMSACGNGNNENSAATTDTMSTAPAPDAATAQQPMDTGLSNPVVDSMSNQADTMRH